MRLRPSLDSCLKGRDGKYVQVSPDLCKKLWHVSTLIQSLHSRDLILLEAFKSLSKLVGGSGRSSTLHGLWAWSQRCGPLRHGVAPKAGKCLAEPIRRLSRFLSCRWFHLVSTFLSYTGPRPHHKKDHMSVGKSASDRIWSHLHAVRLTSRLVGIARRAGAESEVTYCIPAGAPFVDRLVYQRYKRCRWELRVAVITKALIWSAFQRLLSCLQRWRLLKLARRVLVTIRLLDAECPPMLSRELKRPEHPYAVDFGLCILFEFFTYSFFVSVRILSESWIC